MADLPHTPDDISTLWGPAASRGLSPEPPPPDRTRRPPAEAPPGDDDRLKALERQLAAQRADIEHDFGERLARARAETGAEVQSRLAGLDAQVMPRLDAMTRQMAEVVARAGRPVGPQAERVDVLEQQLHEGLTRLHRAVAGLPGAFVAKTDLEALASRLRADLAAQLARARHQAGAGEEGGLDAVRAELHQRVQNLEQQMKGEMAALARSVDTAVAQSMGSRAVGGQSAGEGGPGPSPVTGRAQLERRLRRLEEAMTALVSRVEVMAAERASPVAALRSDVRLLHEELAALSQAVEQDRPRRRRPAP